MFKIFEKIAVKKPVKKNCTGSLRIRKLVHYDVKNRVCLTQNLVLNQMDLFLASARNRTWLKNVKKRNAWKT